MSITSEKQTELLVTLKERFEKNITRHEGLKWSQILKKLKTDTDKLEILNKMEQTGGEPDIIGIDNSTGEYIFYDCSAETPAGRRSLCYDQKALDSRKDNKPVHSAVGMVSEMGIELLSEEEYRNLQKLGKFDAKTSSWIHTPESIRKLGGALFADFRYGNVFVYHNGAESYYSGRGFRGSLKV